MRIPAGVEDGQRIRCQGPRRPWAGQRTSGDLYVVTHVGSHAFFGRRGKNLTLNVPITFTEAALGTTITVPTLDDPVTLRVPPGTTPGQTFRVRGRGVPGAGRRGGDLLVTVEVVVPKKLNQAQRAAVEALAHVLG